MRRSIDVDFYLARRREASLQVIWTKRGMWTRDTVFFLGETLRGPWRFWRVG